MRNFLLFFGIALLVGCQQNDGDISLEKASSGGSEMMGVSSSVFSGATLTIRLEKSTTSDSDGTFHTRALLHLTGALNQTIELEDILGELMYVSPSGYDRFNYENAETVAVVTAWWAGQGEEIYITQFHDPHTLTVEHRYGDESGVCFPPGMIADLPLSGDVEIDLENFGLPTVERSSIDFPCTEP
ncbi:hypothetical protein A2454_06020 [Candidatus Peribacteria bacterium RIFOXYC2_FULL_55_14]|nr:MAG: hypothetical protein UY85_C0020G0009 [Candidatus Peribacteria bacterium GW2011_GWB1_54_5]OGJ71935.1 MAG: hypothetical protein A2198_03545 [Candidatus Peribacteria bacterium RIFOXYA1_FULL_56_14]OGJ72719.1 MAG: hypothetical protein A2217_04515 [Candidatus Peribacteria bacterium RIFOXYA2_FULL_55_28]OGJ75376.1 MAG: hypothetical protein A2384_00540 [Candidatus Peribacteria bacterium RIFOXYB1_FULL_54_35]OGJ76447.1 MAG: hypothetical protein A2327_01330 [Candidatus Peribacteria bacterium RIFOXY